MSVPPTGRQPPRFVPTLTEVVAEPVGTAPSDALSQQPQPEAVRPVVGAPVLGAPVLEAAARQAVTQGAVPDAALEPLVDALCQQLHQQLHASLSMWAQTQAAQLVHALRPQVVEWVQQAQQQRPPTP